MTDKISVGIELFESNADITYDNNGQMKSYISSDKPEYTISANVILNGQNLEKAFDLNDFIRSKKTGEWEIFTCSCGIAGCADIFEGIKVKTRKKTVEWRIPHEHNAGYAFLDRSFYSFDRKEYEDTIDNVIQELTEYAKRSDIFDQFSHGSGENDKLSHHLKYYVAAYNDVYLRWTWA